MRKALQTRSLVAAWFDFLPPEVLPVAQALHRAAQDAEPALMASVRQGNLLLSLDGEPLLALAPGADEVQFVVFNGAELDDRLGPFEGAARRQRLLRFPAGTAVDAAQVEAVAGASAARARRVQDAARR